MEDLQQYRARDGDSRKAGWFEVIVGKSMPTDTEHKCIGEVTDAALSS